MAVDVFATGDVGHSSIGSGYGGGGSSSGHEQKIGDSGTGAARSVSSTATGADVDPKCGVVSDVAVRSSERVSDSDVVLLDAVLSARGTKEQQQPHDGTDLQEAIDETYIGLPERGSDVSCSEAETPTRRNGDIPEASKAVKVLKTGDIQVGPCETGSNFPQGKLLLDLQ